MRHIATTSSILYLLLFYVVIGSAGCQGNEHIQGDEKKTLSYHRQQNDTAKLFKARLIASFCAFQIVKIEDSLLQLWDEPDNALGKKYQHVFTIKHHCEFVNAHV